MKRQQAFSLIELSIVILVIGILIAGLMQGRELIGKTRLQTARSLTASSPVSSIKGLHAWYETSSNNSFDGAVVENNSPVTRWYDINPQKSAKLNLIQNTGSSKPTYKLDSLNNIPAVSFNSNDSLASTINMGMTRNPDFTFFVVAKVQGGAWGAFVASGGITIVVCLVLLGFLAQIMAQYIRDSEARVCTTLMLTWDHLQYSQFMFGQEKQIM